MRRTLVLGSVAIALLFPGTARAVVDFSCSLPTSTSAISGTVQNALGAPLAGMTVELYPTNDARPTNDDATTNGAGRYKICAGESTGAGHNTYDVHVSDRTVTPKYATVNQPYTTFTNLTANADFTPASGLPMLYMTNLVIDPAEISTAASARTVDWTVRSKAPSDTVMRLTLDHLSSSAPMSFLGTEAGGPDAGGWNLWRTTKSFPKNAAEALYWATVRGFDGSTQITEMDRQPYVIDNTPPVFGQAGASICGPGVFANAMTPVSPPGTTNPQPIVVHGVCDAYSNGARSGLDPFSLSGDLCLNSAMTLGCRPIEPVLSSTNIVWWPTAPLALGDYYLRWRISDKAGNVATNPVGYLLRITDHGGQTPIINAVQPGNLGSGNTAGIVVGSSLTTPTSYPYVGFRVTDADGYTDLVPGSLRVRVYYGDERTLVYDYDATKGPNEYDITTGRGGASFDLASGMFRATGFPLQGKQPGRYIATASITDHGGNSATMTWHWLLVGAL